MWRLTKAIMILGLLAGIALVAYAYGGPIFFPADFAAPASEVRLPVILETSD